MRRKRRALCDTVKLLLQQTEIDTINVLLIHKELLLLFKIILEASFVGLFKTKHKKLFWFILHDSYIMDTKERYHILEIMSVIYHEERNHLMCSTIHTPST